MPIINKVLQVPAIGRMVHFRHTPGKCTAAIITLVNQPGNPHSTMSLVLMGTSSILFLQNVQLGNDEGCWHWPEFVPGVADTSVKA